MHFEIILSLSFLKLPIFVFCRTAKILLKFFLRVILNSEFQLFCLEMDDSMLYVNISLVLFVFLFVCFFFWRRWRTWLDPKDLQKRLGWKCWLQARSHKMRGELESEAGDWHRPTESREFKKWRQQRQRPRHKWMIRLVAWGKNNRAARASRFLVQFLK